MPDPQECIRSSKIVGSYSGYIIRSCPMRILDSTTKTKKTKQMYYIDLVPYPFFDTYEKTTDFLKIFTGSISVSNFPTDFPDALSLAGLVLIYGQLDSKTSTLFKSGQNIGNLFALESGGNLAAILAQLDSKTSTLFKAGQSIGNLFALESGGNLAAILAKLDVALSTRALEAGGNLAAILAKLDVALSTRALEAGGNLASIKTDVDHLDVNLSTRALETGGNLATIAGKDFATQTTLALIKAKTDNLDLALSARTLSKHDNKTYIYAFGDISSTGLLTLSKTANKIIKLHFYSLQTTVDGVTAYFYEETSNTQLSKKWVLNAREGQESPFVSAPANLPKCATQNKDIGINISGGTSPHIYWELIYSVDDAS